MGLFSGKKARETWIPNKGEVARAIGEGFGTAMMLRKENAQRMARVQNDDTDRDLSEYTVNNYEAIAREVAKVLRAGPIKLPKLSISERLSKDGGERLYGEMLYGDWKIALYTAQEKKYVIGFLAHELTHAYMFKMGYVVPPAIREGVADAVAYYVRFKFKGKEPTHAAFVEKLTRTLDDEWKLIEMAGFVAERHGLVDARSALGKAYNYAVGWGELDSLKGEQTVNDYMRSRLAIGRIILERNDKPIPQIIRDIADNWMADRRLRALGKASERIGHMVDYESMGHEPIFPLNEAKRTARREAQIRGNVLRLRDMLRDVEKDRRALCAANA